MVNTFWETEYFYWHKEFKERCEDVQDDQRSGQPKAQRADPKMDKVQTMVWSD
jgi:hypothetical protein